MIDDLVKLDLMWFKKHLIGEGASLKDLLNTAALIMISFGFKNLVSALTKTNIYLIRNDKTVDENTDSVIDNTKALDSIGEDIKELKFMARQNKNE